MKRASEARAARRRARNRHPSGQQVRHVVEELVDGCPVCDELKQGREEAALEAMFRQPPPGEHRIALMGDGRDDWVQLLAHGQEWQAPVDVFADGPVACPDCGEAVSLGW